MSPFSLLSLSLLRRSISLGLPRRRHMTRSDVCTDSHVGSRFHCDTVVSLFLYSPSALFPAWELCMSQAPGRGGDLTDEVHRFIGPRASCHYSPGAYANCYCAPTAKAASSRPSSTCPYYRRVKTTRPRLNWWRTDCCGCKRAIWDMLQ